MTPRIMASFNANAWKSKSEVSPPIMIVRGSPIPSRRSGIDTSRLSARKFTREESENSTTASVASASVRTVELVG